jgi:hypothetical protein
MRKFRATALDLTYVVEDIKIHPPSGNAPSSLEQMAVLDLIRIHEESMKRTDNPVESFNSRIPLSNILSNASSCKIF